MSAQNFTNQKIYFAQSLLSYLESENPNESDRLSCQLLLENCLTQFYLAYRALVLEIAEHYQVELNASISNFDVNRKLISNLEAGLSEKGFTSPELKQLSNLNSDKESYLSLLSRRFEQLIVGQLWPSRQGSQQRTNIKNTNSNSRKIAQLIDIEEESSGNYNLLEELGIINKAMRILVEETRNSLQEY